MIVDAPVSAEEQASFLLRSEQFKRNAEWFRAHVDEIWQAAPGQYVCVAGQEFFVSPNLAEAFSQARAAHPDEGGGVNFELIRKTTPSFMLVSGGLANAARRQWNSFDVQGSICCCGEPN